MSTKPSSLTDTQLVVLTAAAAREDGRLLPPPSTVKARGGALTASLQSLIDKGYAAEVEAGASDPLWREDSDQGRLTLRITETAFAALGLSDQEPTHAPPSPAPETGGDGVKARKSPHGSKRDQLIERLSTEAGTSVEELTELLGWLPHTLRAAISGLRKQGVEIETLRDGGITVYRSRLAVAAAPVAAETNHA